MANFNLDEDIELTRLYVSCRPQERAGVFKKVYDRYASSLFRFVFRFTANAQAAEEILHDIFVQLLDERFTASGDASLKAWLFTLAKNRGLNHAKRASTSKLTIETDSSEARQLLISDDFETQLISKNLLSRLMESESVLTLELKETWELRKQGLDYQQIGFAQSRRPELEYADFSYGTCRTSDQSRRKSQRNWHRFKV